MGNLPEIEYWIVAIGSAILAAYASLTNQHIPMPAIVATIATGLASIVAFVKQFMPQQTSARALRRAAKK